MASNPSEVGGHGPNLDPEKSPIKTLSESKLGNDEIGVSGKKESRDPNRSGDVDREEEEGFVNGDSVEKGDSVIGGASAEKEDSFVAVEANGNKETGGSVGSVEEKEAAQNPELEKDQNVQVEKQEQQEEGEKTDAVENDQQGRYCFSLQEDRTGVSIGDLVWGKVRSYPWWPGQIFDPKYASKMALKLQKKDHFLVAYFGDKSFAWVPESQLKPFQAHFSAMEKQSSMVPFVNAVDAILEEVSRRVELGMACHCLWDEIYTILKYMKVENAGICEGTCGASVDGSMFVNAFQSESLLEYVRVLAQCPCGGFDRLELKIATAQLRAFYWSKGHPELPVFVCGLGLVENDAEIPLAESRVSGKGMSDSLTLAASSIKSGKRPRSRPPKNQAFEDNNEQKSLSKPKEEEDVDHLAKSTPVTSNIKSGKRPRGRPRKNHISEDGSEQMVDKDVDYSARASGKKHKVVGSESADLGRSKKERFGKEANAETDAPSSTRARSFKVGDSICRVASQLKESLRSLKSNDETLQNNVAKKNHRKGAGDSSKATKQNEVVVEDYSSPSEMLSQLCLVATDPMDEYTFLRLMVAFFTNFRASLAPSSSEDLELGKSIGRKRGRKKKVTNTEPVTSEMSELDYSPPSEMLSQLCLVATDPMDQYTFLRMTIGFFTNFRTSLAPSSSEDQELGTPIGRKRGRKKKVTNFDPDSSEMSDQEIGKPIGRKRGRKKKVANSEPDSSEMSDPDYMQDSSDYMHDSYWSDIVLQSSPEREPVSRGQKRKGNSEKKGQKKKTKHAWEPLLSAPIDPLLDTEDGQLVGASNPNDKQEVKGKRIISYVEEKIEEETPTALILSFNESNALPSTAELIKIFSPYGSLREEETEVLRKTTRAKVVFKYSDDADKAFSSAGKYKVFGPALVSYRLRPLYKSSPASSPEDKNELLSKSSPASSPEDKND